MSKKHIFLSIFSKITISVCVFCTLSAWSDTTTCDIDFTPVTGNSWQNGTPTPTNPVAIESIGTKVGNKYAVQVAINNGGGVVDLGTLDWIKQSGFEHIFKTTLLNTLREYGGGVYISGYTRNDNYTSFSVTDKQMWALSGLGGFAINDFDYTDAASFKQAMSGVYLYYQRTTDETWTAPTLRTVYLDEPLRKVGDYADVLDYKKGQIIRNVGVKAFDGTENWSITNARNYAIRKTDLGADFTVLPSGTLNIICSHYPTTHTDASGIGHMWVGGSYVNFVGDSSAMDLNAWKAYLAQQYAAGTPVTVYYPLATPVVEQIENWSCTPPITDIKIATTKMVDEEFAAAEAKLATTVQTIESVVSRTITQTGQIATLQETKQTRPDENCPANMKCLLVQDEDGTPHWYPIIEP